MHIDPIAVVGVIVLTLLTVLLTGPGMWSEKWGWRTLHRRGRERPEAERGAVSDARSRAPGDPRP